MAERGSWREVARSAYWREDDAREVIAAWRRSGENRAQFCRAHGLAVARLSRWIARLEQATTIPFDPVRLRGVVGDGSDVLVVELPGVATIRLVPGFAVEDLRRILSAFEADGC
jgi:hypothetical protein